MDVKAKVNLFNKPESNLKATASISLNDDFVVRGLRVLNGEKGLFVAMPSQKVGEEYRDVCFALSSDLREKINTTVLEAYEQELKQSQEQKQESERDAKKEKSPKRSASKSQKNAPSDTQTGQEMQSDEKMEEQVDEGPAMSM